MSLEQWCVLALLILAPLLASVATARAYRSAESQAWHRAARARLDVSGTAPDPILDHYARFDEDMRA